MRHSPGVRLDYLSIDCVKVIGALTVNPANGFIGSLLINRAAKPSGVNDLEIRGPISISAGLADSLVTGTIQNVNIQRLKNAQSLTIGAGYKSDIGNITINSASACIGNAQFAGAINVNVDDESGSLGSLSVYGTRFTTVTVAANGPIGDVRISAESVACNPATTGAISVKTNSKSIRSFAVLGMATTGSVTVAANVGNISSFILAPRAAGTVAINGALLLTTLVAGTGSVKGVVLGPVATVQGLVLVEARGGPVDTVQVVGPATGTRFMSTITVSSAGAPVSLKTGNVRSVLPDNGLGWLVPTSRSHGYRRAIHGVLCVCVSVFIGGMELPR